MAKDPKDKSKKMEHLKNMEMPSRKGAEEPDLEEMEMDFDDEMGMDEAASVEEGSPLADFSDDELMAEMEARGLMGDLEGGDDDEEEEEDPDFDDEDLDIFDPEMVS